MLMNHSQSQPLLFKPKAQLDTADDPKLIHMPNAILAKLLKEIMNTRRERKVHSLQPPRTMNSADTVEENW